MLSFGESTSWKRGKMRGILNLATVIVGGVMLADLVANSQGTTALFNGIGSLWSTSINGLLGKAS
jgi:hypothetical protein